VPAADTRVAVEDAEFASDTGARDAQRELEAYVDAICARLPSWFCRWLVWLRRPSRWPLRIFAALTFLIGGLLSFLPVLGLWMLPLGLIVIAQDVPALRRPLLRAFRWADRRSQAWRRMHAAADER
jgi:hypothetical protein